MSWKLIVVMSKGKGYVEEPESLAGSIFESLRGSARGQRSRRQVMSNCDLM
jgi:hypothetical protein